MNVFKNLFKEVGIKDVITLFHKPANPASMRVIALLKQTAAAPEAHATIDQASEHSKPAPADHPEFKLEVEENAPTADQLSLILGYLGPGKAGSIVQGASGTTDALRKFKEDQKTFQAPVVVDWGRGKAVAGDDESQILKLIRERPQ